jgi:hypothetical protein
MTRFALLGVAVLALAACSRDASKDVAKTRDADTNGAPGDAPKTPKASKAAKAPPKIKFRVQEVVDAPQGGLVALRFAVPQDWKGGGRIEWHYDYLYTPMRGYARGQAPDGSAWIDFYPFELFYWLDPRWDNFKTGPNSGGIHQRNITLREAVQRYVIARYRGRERNLRIVGARPVKNLSQALGKPPVAGEGIDVRVRYTLGNDPVDEEFFAMMSPLVTIPYHGPQGTTYEYHRSLFYVHSLGAKNGKLESMRPLLGYIARSLETDKIWEKHRDAVMQQLAAAYDRNLAAGYAQIEAAGRRSRAISANNDAMIRSMDAQRAAANNRQSSGTQTDPYRATENFDQYIRGTERMEDSSGNVSEQSSMYNYHWTDGYGTVVHSNDATFDPNNHSNQTFEKMKPAR